MEWARGSPPAGALRHRTAAAAGRWRAALPGQKLRRWHERALLESQIRAREERPQVAVEVQQKAQKQRRR
jgi:hypothetical protein